MKQTYRYKDGSTWRCNDKCTDAHNPIYEAVIFNPLNGQRMDNLFATHPAVENRIAALADKKIVAAGTVKEIVAVQHPWVQAYFHGERALRREGAAG